MEAQEKNNNKKYSEYVDIKKNSERGKDKMTMNNGNNNGITYNTIKKNTTLNSFINTKEVDNEEQQ